MAVTRWMVVLVAGCAAPPAASLAPPAASAPVAREAHVPAGVPALEAEGREEAACWAQPFAMKEARLAPQPLTADDTARLELLTNVRDGACLMPTGMARFPPFRIPEPECLYEAGRTHFERSQWPEAARSFKQMWERFPAHEASIYAAQLYLECLNLMAHAAEPPRPICYQVMERDVERIACAQCQPGTPEIEQCTLLQRIRFELPLRDTGKMPFAESDVACGAGQRFAAGACRPLPPLTPTQCP